MSESFSDRRRAKTGAPATVEHVISVDGVSDAEILGERRFMRMLCLERKRTERSSRRFVLMLLECRSELQSGRGRQLLEKVLRGLSHSTRETDIRGWYKDGSVIGVIFTEIGAGESAVAVSTLWTRVSTGLSGILSVEQINEIRLSFHVYPEDSLKPGAGGPSDLPLYPDLGPAMREKRASRFVKRSMDIAGSLVALLLSAPVLLAISVIIKLTSSGPSFFRQERVGLHGRRFTFLKFRSMYFANDSTIHEEFMKRVISGTTLAERAAGNRTSAYKLSNDPRVTPVGRLLRRTSLDELPQFFNVLTGAMSLVGPRPPIPYELDCYAAWHTQRLLSVKPGITGLWQVNGRSTLAFDEMVRLDLQYARSWSLWLDIKTLWKTPGAVLSGEGAY